MVSALTVLLLSCWLAGHSAVWGGREFLKPTISVSPSRVVALGGSVTIRCEGSYPGREFFLHKAGHPNLQVQTVPDGTVAEFPIPSVSQEDGGSYTCDYRSITDQNCTSHPSDAVEIIVGEPSYPKPSISLSPSWGVALGGAMAVWCQGQHRGVRFVLNKERHHFPPVDSNGLEAVFPISKVRWEDRGSYSCSYHSRSEPFAVSSPSDPVELVLRDAGSIPISKVRQEDGESYSCSNHNRSEPFTVSSPSDPVELVLRAAAPLDFTNANITRLALGTVVLLVLGLILAEAYYSHPRGTS